MGVLPPSPVTVSRSGLHASGGSDADRTVVWLRGEHDIATVVEVSETMAAAIALDSADLVVDLSAVKFIDAATVGAIVRARELLRFQSRALAVRSPSACAQRVLELCELAHLVEPAGQIVEPAGQIVEPAGQIVEPAGQIVEPAGQIVEAVGASIDAHPAQGRSAARSSRGGP